MERIITYTFKICTLDYCDVGFTNGCGHTPIMQTNSSFCDDGDKCTADFCQNSKCVHAPETCNNLNTECTFDLCGVCLTVAFECANQLCQNNTCNYNSTLPHG